MLQKNFWRQPIADGLAVSALLAFCFFFLGFLLRDDLFIYGDNPGQFFRVWQAMSYAWPLRGRLIDWSPFWYAGYPDLQFYPPGFAILGWALKQISLGLWSDFYIYQLLLFISFALPGFTVYYALTRLGFGRIAGLSGGLCAIIFPGALDGSLAPLIGLIGSRLGFGLIPLVFTWSVLWLEKGGWLNGLRAVLLLALTILVQVFYSVGALVGVFVFQSIALKFAPRISFRLLALIAGAAAIAAFWVVPLFAHSTQAIPLLRATLDATWHNLSDAQHWPYYALALIAVARLGFESDARRRALLLTLTTWFIVQMAMVLVDYWLLIGRLQFYALEPVRFIGAAYIALIMLAGIGVGTLAERLRPQPLAAATLTTGIMLLVCWPFPSMLAPLRERAGEEPIWLSEITRAYRLDDLWSELRKDSGRILFTSNYANLRQFSPHKLPTTLMSLTPYFAQRDIMGGTYSNWSAIAALMWVGQTRPPVLFGRVELNDDVSLFGMQWTSMDVAQFIALCQAFDVQTIVATRDDVNARTFLDRAPPLHSYWNDGWHFLYRVRDYQPTLLETRNARAELMAYTPTQLHVRVRQAAPDARLTVKILHYPLWVVCAAQTCLATQADELGRLSVNLPEGDSDLLIAYRDDAAQLIGGLLSTTAVSMWLMCAGWRAWRQVNHARIKRVRAKHREAVLRPYERDGQ